MDGIEFVEELGEAMFDSEYNLQDIQNVSTFEEAGVLTNNVGLVVEMQDGSEFQVTIVRSK